jgi:hypothetical protein
VLIDTTKKYRDVFAFGLLAVAALYLIGGLSMLFKSADQLNGASFSTRASAYGYLFDHPLLIVALVGAIALAVGFGEPSHSSRTVTLAALALGAVSLLFAVVSWLAAFGADGGFGYAAGIAGAGTVVGAILGLASLLFLALTTWYAYTAYQGLPRPVQAASQWGAQGGWAQQQGGWGQPQGGYGQPAQPGWGQQQGYGQPQPGWPQPQGWGQPQPGYPAAGQPEWGPAGPGGAPGGSPGWGSGSWEDPGRAQGQPQQAPSPSAQWQGQPAAAWDQPAPHQGEWGQPAQPGHTWTQPAYEPTGAGEEAAGGRMDEGDWPFAADPGTEPPDDQRGSATESVPDEEVAGTEQSWPEAGTHAEDDPDRK